MTDKPQYPSYPGPEQPETPPPGPTPPAPPPGYGQAPPPPGDQPPPAPGYGQAAPTYGQLPPTYGQQPPPGYVPPNYGQSPPGSYAGWWSRVGAYLLDSLIGVAVSLPALIIGFAILGATGTETTRLDGTTSTTGESPLGYVFVAIGYVIAIGFAIWNYAFRQGRTGQTLGKKIVGIKVVEETSGQPTGAGLAFGRMLLISILTLFTCYLNLLWPLWDNKHQALHDKVVSTLVVTA